MFSKGNLKAETARILLFVSGTWLKSTLQVKFLNPPSKTDLTLILFYIILALGESSWHKSDHKTQQVLQKLYQISDIRAQGVC